MSRSVKTTDCRLMFFGDMWISVLPLLVALSLLQGPDYTTATHDWLDYKYGRQDSAELHDKKHFCSWKCLLFTLQWPGAFCQSLDEETPCRVPVSVTSWTIHGLWPVKAFRCCRCWPMFPSDVQELEAELTEHWPSLLQTQPSFHFWLLEDAGITPTCERPYKVAEVRQVLAPHLGDRLEIQCVTDDQDRELWFQVKIPLSHNLTAGCDHRGDGDADWDVTSGRGAGRNVSDRHPCPPRGVFYYVPIVPQRPRRPCG
ncbi:ribonuclease T2-like isoform X2 [Etheostoma spectabile]|uniref:ribonuclease T2-like isoform X2 n=1 Tax=Etheostoma spectabile TaxID=54343 RepID=UPI0013AE8963|nr:uncharacterized protein LOC116678983 isoform X2 [Etheostoma spectabile]